MTTPPPPWQLEGDGWVLLLRTSPDAGRHWRWCRMVMAMHYANSPIGPYRELLSIPGRRGRGTRARWSITRIFVSTPASVAAGRDHWRIPKQHADFRVEADARAERIVVSRGDAPIARLALVGGGPAVPASASWIPPMLRTLAQPCGDTTWHTTPSGRARVRRARLVSADVDADAFGSFAPADVLAAFRLTRFAACFPRPRIARVEAPHDRATS